MTRHESDDPFHPIGACDARHHAYPTRCRRGRVEKRLSFPYGRTLVVGRFFALVSLIVLIAVAVAFLPSLSIGPVAFLAAILAVYFVLFAVSPLLTEHWVTRSRLILRQGWYFRTVIPFSV